MVKEFETKGYMTLILGGSSGLGLAAAEKLAAQGMGICIVHRNTRSEMRTVTPAFERIQSHEVPFMSFNMDVMDAPKREAVLAALQPYRGRFRCILHSIAKGSLKTMDSAALPPLSTEDLKLTLDYMAFSLYDWVMAFRDAGLLAADARVLAFTSEGSHKAWKHYAAVATAKAALEALIRNMALELAPYGIRANCIQAGITPTASMKRIPGSDTLEAATPGRNPFGRMTRPGDVADVVYLLCKDEAAWINGSIIPVDGGEHIC
ncbi:SDR family oxidoreductase [Taibaiella koreensis]|uniref:SDR family oxidoreductase n=1 Tax=Taibaiella koreensis TaxID=1268548 RepID=UPI000E59DEBE|nr:SDR family oxidoreductase [Taibaiella koreensis]